MMCGCFFCLRCGGVPINHELGFQDEDGPCLGERSTLAATLCAALTHRVATEADEPQGLRKQLMFQALVLRCRKHFPLLGIRPVLGLRRPVGELPFCPPEVRTVAASAVVPCGTFGIAQAVGAAVPPLPAPALRWRLPPLQQAGPSLVPRLRRPVGELPFCPPEAWAVAASVTVPSGTFGIAQLVRAAVPPLLAPAHSWRQPPLKRAGPALTVALHRSKRHCAGPGPRQLLEASGRATLWAAFARGVGPSVVHAAVAGCPSGIQ